MLSSKSVSVLPTRFEFPLDTVKGLNLNLRLFDHDSFTRDDFLGKCAIPLKQLSKTGDEHTEALLGKVIEYM